MSWYTSLSSKLRELRFVCCQVSGHSQGVRDFVTTNYAKVKETNPTFPFIVRECNDAIPLVIARYDFGVEKKVCLEGHSEQQINQVVQDLLNQADSINSHRFLQQ